MIKAFFTSVLLILALNTQAWAQDHGHTPEVCSAENVCAHLGHMSKIDSSTEASFVAHVMTPDEQQIENLKIILWMPEMGHGSSPVTVAQFGVNKYKVSKAFFVMPGQWEVRISFTLGQTSHQINIPMNVEE